MSCNSGTVICCCRRVPLSVFSFQLFSCSVFRFLVFKFSFCISPLALTRQNHKRSRRLKVSASCRQFPHSEAASPGNSMPPHPFPFLFAALYDPSSGVCSVTPDSAFIQQLATCNMLRKRVGQKAFCMLPALLIDKQITGCVLSLAVSCLSLDLAIALWLWLWLWPNPCDG